MEGEEKEVQKAIEAVGKQEQPFTYDSLIGILHSILDTGKMPKEALGFSPERMDNSYAQAYVLYNTGKFVDASHIFRFLVILDSTEPKYYLGLAACLHMLKDYEDAAKVYMGCAMIDQNSPIPYFHASDCFIQMRDKGSAILMLEMAMQRSGERPEFQVLKERSRLMIENLKKEIEQSTDVAKESK